MSIAVLNQVYTETRRLAIAGSNLSVGDFRLKKLIEPLEKSAQKAPVFGTVAKAIDKLINGKEKDSAQSLLDLCSLVLAILYTQGQTDIEGQSQDIESKELTLSSTQMPARTLKPLIEALTSIGGGRMQTIQEGYERGAFQDIRLVNAAVEALDDDYSEIADFVTDNVLPRYGTAIVPEICDRIDINGRAGNVRRLRLLHNLAPELARPIVLQAFEKGSKEMRIAAIGCLGDSAEDLPFLLEQAESKNKEVRRVALSRLGKYQNDDSIAILVKALGGADRSLAIESVCNSQSKKLWEVVLATTKKELDDLLSTKTRGATAKDKEKFEKALSRFDELLACYQHRQDSDAIAQLAAIYDQRNELRKLKGTPISGEDVYGTLCEVMFSTMDPKLHQRLIHDRQELLNNRFICSVAAGLWVLSPKEFYDAYSGFFIEKPTKSRSPYSGSPRELILTLLPGESDGRGGFGWAHLHRHFATPNEILKQLRSKKWDPRWLEAAIAADEMQCAIRLGNSQHAGLRSYLLNKFATSIKKKDIDYDVYWVLRAIVDFEYQEATDCWMQALAKQAKSTTRRYYSIYFLAPLVSKLPKGSAAAIEQALVGLPDQTIDEIMPHLQTLRAKA